MLSIYIVGKGVLRSQSFEPRGWDFFAPATHRNFDVLRYDSAT